MATRKEQIFEHVPYCNGDISAREMHDKLKIPHNTAKQVLQLLYMSKSIKRRWTGQKDQEGEFKYAHHFRYYRTALQTEI